MKTSKDTSNSDEIVIIKRNIRTSKKPKLLFAPTTGYSPEPVIPSEPKDELGIKYYPLLKSFVLSHDAEEDFPQIIDSNEKYRLHQMAEAFNLNHFKRGTNQKKFITVQKRNVYPLDQFQYIGYIGLFGGQVEQCAKLFESIIPFHCLQQCHKRDGPIHHITLMLKQDILKSFKKIPEIPEYMNHIDSHKWRDQKLECLMDLMCHVIEDDWRDLGLGQITTEATTSYFKVISWPSATKFRKNLGLDHHDFNITIGFKTIDVHDIPKTLDTLVKTSPVKSIPFKSELESFLDYLEIPPHHCQTFLINGWNFRNIQFIQQQDIKDLGLKHEHERILLNWLCNYKKNLEIYERRCLEQRYM
jgi:hypothetical protein